MHLQKFILMSDMTDNDYKMVFVIVLAIPLCAVWSSITALSITPHSYRDTEGVEEYCAFVLI